MYRTACIVTRDRTFGQFVRLTLKEYLPSVTLSDPDGPLPVCDLTVVDLDTASLPEAGGTLLCCSARRDKPEGFPHLWLDRPFRPARLVAVLALGDQADPPLPLYPLSDRPAVMEDGEEIALTETEYALFLALWEAEGAFVDRETLLRAVWGEGQDGAIVNVYIHYLRSKLERNGRRYLHAKRGGGYALRRGEV